MTNIFSILCLAIVGGRFASISARDYCHIDTYCTTYNHKIHTMCKFPSSQPSARCTGWTKQGLTNSEKKIIVKKHNELRQKVASGNEMRGNPGPQPPAVSMPNLKWDHELELIAQRWANQCADTATEIKHDKCRDVDIKRFPSMIGQVGQNIYVTPASSADSPFDVEAAVQKWYNEVDQFPNFLVSSYQYNDDYGHYSQLVWGKTTLIGCGRISYKDKSGNPFSHHIICNYGESGNLPGAKVYEIQQ